MPRTVHTEKCFLDLVKYNHIWVSTFPIDLAPSRILLDAISTKKRPITIKILFNTTDSENISLCASFSRQSFVFFFCAGSVTEEQVFCNGLQVASWRAANFFIGRPERFPPLGVVGCQLRTNLEFLGTICSAMLEGFEGVHRMPRGTSPSDYCKLYCCRVSSRGCFGV